MHEARKIMMKKMQYNKSLTFKRMQSSLTQILEVLPPNGDSDDQDNDDELKQIAI